MRYLVTGASGLLGLNLSLWLAKEHEVVGVIHRPELKDVPFPVAVTDLSLPGACSRIIEQAKPEVIIHTAAMAIVDECENQPERAERVNSELPGTLAEISRKLGIQMLHISTDAVFDGQRGGYSEEDKPNPLSVYARTKLSGEQAVTGANPDAMIARVNFYGFSLRGQRSLAETFVKNLEAGEKMKGFTDVFFCSLYVLDLSKILIKMLQSKLSGLYHTAAHECISKYEFGIRIAQRFGFNTDLILPIPVNDSGLVAKRSPNLCLNVSKLEKVLGESMPMQDDGLQHFFEAYQRGAREMLQGFLME
jgi:dTDP-4-dehydrorhamnose reductase